MKINLLSHSNIKVMLLSLSVSFFIGCGNSEDSDSTKNTSKNESAAALVKEINTIVALSPHSVETLFALGAGDKIVGTTEYADYPEAAKEIKRIGGYHGIQMESLLELNPDLVVVWDGGNKPEDIKRIEALGFKLFRSQANKFELLGSEILELGKLIGHEAQAIELAQSLLDRYDTLVESNRTKTKVKYFYQLWPKPLRTMGPGTWIAKVIEGCGGVNILNDPNLEYPEVSIEEVVLTKPDIILVPGHSADIENQWDIWKPWPEIPAVKNNQFYQLNGDHMHRFSPRILDGMESVCEIFDQVRQQQLN